MFDQSSDSEKPAIVLVHGAWADASCWNGVIAQLHAAGHTVYAPPNPLRSLVSDAATIATYVKSIPGPAILVGHSYGGAVISVASPSTPNASALDYVDGFAPDEGENCASILSSSPPPPPLQPFAAPVTTTAVNVGRHPRYYITTMRDQAVGPTLQKTMYLAQPIKHVYTIDTDHSSYFSATDQLAEAMLDVRAVTA